MTLPVDLQARAARLYIEGQLNTSKQGSEILKDRQFINRLDGNFVTLHASFMELYGHRGDCLNQLADLVMLAGRSWCDRSADLKVLDRARELNSEWYMSNKMLGGVCYVDRYAGNLAGIRAKIPYFKELGLTYLHLMPLFDRPEPLNDGGYAVTNYRKVMPSLGTIDELKDLATELRTNGISLVLDMVFNHTSNEHEWAKQAVAGNPQYSSYYWIFPDRSTPDAFEKTTREIFPFDPLASLFYKIPFTLRLSRSQAAYFFCNALHSRWQWSCETFYSKGYVLRELDRVPDLLYDQTSCSRTVGFGSFCDPKFLTQFSDNHRGSFICLPDGRWVWSTFYHFQWDLNYSNPEVLRAMAGELLFLANLGIEIFRMDAVAFIWKRMNTSCESLPEAHKILRAFNCLCRIAAPLVLFKSEAIVHPDEVLQYIDLGECPLSYNPLQMALTWEALATCESSMLSQAIERRHNLPRGCSWINYVRSHDDIGWTFSDEDAAELGIDGFSHRRFLNSFFVNRHPGSFARGVPFQDNPRTGDCRISGTTASLAGLENVQEGALERILLAYSIALSTGGIPLIYLGDEVGMLNDYSYLDDPSHSDDSRWVNRPKYPDDRYAARFDTTTIPGRVFSGIIKLIQIRKSTPELGGSDAEGYYTANKHVLGYQRMSPHGAVLCLVNCSDHSQSVARDRFTALPGEAKDLITGNAINLGREGIHLRAHQYAWLKLWRAVENGNVTE